MKKMIKLWSLLLILIVCASGCSDESLLLQYTVNNTGTDSISSFVASDKTYRCEYRYKDVCIIPEKAVSVPSDMSFRSEGVLLVNKTNNEMILSKNIYERLYPASLTKLATALVCLKYGNMDDIVTVSYNAAHITEPGAKLCFLQEGDRINFKTLLTSFIVYSGNDAGIALAEHISGTEAAFVELMNSELKKLGAVDTHFVNSHGLPDDNHYTTVYDMYIIMNELLNYDVFNEIAAIDSYIAEFTDSTGKEVKKLYENTNQYLIGLRKIPKGINITASKTGTTFAAGSCLIQSVTNKKEQTYIAVIMKAPDSNVLYNEMSTLLEKAK